MDPADAPSNPERDRLEAQRQGREDWRLWGPYVSERAWGTVREVITATWGRGFRVPAPCLGGRPITLREAATLIAERLVDLFRRGPDGRIPAYGPDSPLQHDPHWQDLHLYHEHFHGETGQGLGAAHQTGWTALVANLVFRRYRQDIPEYWKASPSGSA